MLSVYSKGFNENTKNQHDNSYEKINAGMFSSLSYFDSVSLYYIVLYYITNIAERSTLLLHYCCQ